MRVKEVLYAEYQGFADKRIKNIERGSLFIVDDRSSADHGADKQLFSWFCMIFAEVTSETTVEITMRGGVPDGPTVEKWVSENRRKLAITDEDSLSFTIQKGQETKLLDLASAVAGIVGAGKRYDVKAYKYVCPRTAASLRRLSAVLAKAWAHER